MKPFLLAAFPLFLSLNCSGNQVRPIPPEKATACEVAESRMIELNCRRKDGGPRWLSKGGNHFKDVCQTAYTDGRDWKPECIAIIVSCDEIDQFYEKGCLK